MSNKPKKGFPCRSFQKFRDFFVTLDGGGRLGQRVPQLMTRLADGVMEIRCSGMAQDRFDIGRATRPIPLANQSIST